MLGCLVFLGAFISARFAVFLTWAFTDRMSVAFASGGVGVLGFLFLPWTTLAWAWFYDPVQQGVDGFGLILVIFAFLVDLGSYGSGDRERRRRARA